MSITFVETLPATLALEDGGALNVLLFGLTVLALAWFAPMLASEVVQGQPHLSGSDAIRTGVGASFTTIGAGMVTNMAVNKIAGMAGAGVRAAGRALGGRRRRRKRRGAHRARRR